MGKKHLVTAVLVILLSLIVGCSNEGNSERKILFKYYEYLRTKSWANAYELLSTPSQKKITLAEFVDWAKLADSVQEPGKVEVVKQTKVTEFGNNEELLSFSEVNVVTAEVTMLNKINSDPSTKKETEKVNFVIVQEDNEFKIYLQELEKFSYYKLLGAKYQAEKNYGEAIKQYEKALAQEEDVWVKYHLAENLAQTGRTDEAINLLQEVVRQNEIVLSLTPIEELKENLIGSYHFLANLLEKKGELDRAQEYLNRIDELKR